MVGALVHHLLDDIGLSVIAAALFGTLAYMLKQPSLLGYLLAGALLGPGIGFGLVADPDTVEVISEIGLILLLFVIGLEMDLRALASSGRQLFVAGIGEFVLSVILGVVTFTVLAGQGWLPALYIGLLTSLSSTAVVVKLLYDKFELDTRAGRMTLGILVIQDLWAILILAFQPNLASPQISIIFVALAKSALLIGFGYAVSRFVLQPLFAKISRSPETVVLLSIGWCAVLAAIGGYLELSKEMGALIAGISVASFPYSIHVTAKTLPVRDFFLTLFFMSLGMKIAPPTLSIIFGAAALVLFTLVSRFLSIYPLLRITGAGPRTSFITSLNLAQISEFSLVIAALGVEYKHISPDILATLTYAMGASCVLSSYGIILNHRIYAVFEKVITKLGLFPATHEHEDDAAHGSHDIVLLGYHHTARELVQRLAREEPELLHKVLVIDFNTESLREIRALGAHGMFGDLSSLDTLSHAHLDKSKLLVCSIPDLMLKGTSNRELVRCCRALAPKASILAMADNDRHLDELREEGADDGVAFHVRTAECLKDLIIAKYGTDHRELRTSAA